MDKATTPEGGVIARPRKSSVPRERLSLISTVISWVVYTACLIAFGLAVFLSAGCAGTLQDKVDTGLVVAGKSVGASYAAVSAHYKEKCMRHAKACGDGDKDECLALDRCQDDRGKAIGAIKTLALAIAQAQQVMQKVGINP